MKLHCPVVFVGPSLPQLQSSKVLHNILDIRPPIRRGDLKDLYGHSKPIAIIDGVFHQSLAITAREILDLLKKGVVIYGCSSMGALRAAELELYGMIGIGEVFQMYRSREVQSDAEVALVFDPLTYENLSIPLVAIRYGLKQAVKNSLIDKEDAREFFNEVGKIHFAELTYFRFFQEAEKFLPMESYKKLQSFFQNNKERFDIKAIDARLLLSLIDKQLSLNQY